MKPRLEPDSATWTHGKHPAGAPLADRQLGMWLDEQASPGSIAYNVTAAVRVFSDGDPHVARRVLEHLVAVHPVLRTAIVQHDGVPVRTLLTPDVVDFEVIDATSWSGEEVDCHVASEHLVAFDLETGPLYRFRLLNRGAGEFLLTITVHHIVCDLWTLALIGHEVASTYSALSSGEVPPGVVDVGFEAFAADEAAYVASPKGELALAYWRPVFESVVPPDMPWQRPRPDTFSGTGAVHAIGVSGAVWLALRDRARSLGVAPRAFVLAAFHALLRDLTGVDRTHILEMKANRTARQSRAMGCFVNPVLRTAALSPETTFADLVAAVDGEMSASRPYERYPFGNAARSTSFGTRDGCFEIAFAWQKTTRVVDRDMVSALASGSGGAIAPLDGIMVSPYETHARSAPSPLLLIGAPLDDGLELAFEYQTERFDAEAITMLARRLLALLEQVVDDPDTVVAALDITMPEERDAWIAEWEAAQHQGGDLPTALDLFDRRRAVAPTSTAVRTSTESVTYEELGRRSERLAELLGASGVRSSDLVGICLDRSVDMVASMIAVWRVGAGYVPIDPSFPTERVLVMLDDAHVGVVVTTPTLWARVTADVETDGLRVVDPSDEPIHRAGPSAHQNAAARPSADDVAYVIFTSGSTGRPKGVVVEHHSLSNLLHSMAREPGFSHSDVMLATTTLSFDISVLELLLPLTAGGEIVLLTREEALEPRMLASALATVTVAQGTPTMWRMLVSSGWTGERDLTILCGGEALPTDLVRELLPRCRTLWNMYGPTETTVWSAIHRIDAVDAGATAAIGRPIAATRLYVLDPSGRMCPNGTLGELWIGGAGVARGYIGRPELTDAQFVADPFADDGGRMYRTGDLARRRRDGALICEGRIDDQIKLRGHRVELGEIEAALARHPGVTAAAAVVHRFGDDDLRLVGYVVAAPSTLIDVDSVREGIRRLIPDYMVPAHVVRLAAMPITPNQKVDRQRLPKPEPAHDRKGGSVSLAPSSDPVLAEAVLEICRRVFEDDALTFGDDFFALGGHSLMATRIVARVRAELDRQIPVRALYEHPVLGQFVELVASSPRRPDSASDDALGPLGDDDRARRAQATGSLVPLAHSQRRMWFMQQLDPLTTAYNLVGALRVRGKVDVSQFEAVAAHLVEIHPALRGHVVLIDHEPHLSIHDHVPVDLPVVDLSELDADEPNARLAEVRSRMRSLGAQPFDLSAAPLFRFVCFRLAADDHVVGAVIHHLVADQWAIGVVVADALRTYRSMVTGTGLETIAPADHDRHGGGSVDLDAQLEYWRAHLRSLPVIELPTDRPRSEWRSDRGGTIEVPITDELRRSVRTVVMRDHVSEFMVYLAALQVLVHRITGAQDVPVGVPIANRQRLESEGVVTSLVNTLVIRTDLVGIDTLGATLARVRNAALDAFAHQDLPFERLVDDLNPPRAGRRSPLFQVFLNVQNTPFVLTPIDGLDVEVLPIARDAAGFELSVSIDSLTTNRITIEYAADLFDRSRVERWVAEYVEIVASFVDPAMGVSGEFMSADGSSGAAADDASGHATHPEADSDTRPHLELERELVEIWERVLGTSSIGRHDDFFALGGHSVLAVRIFAELERLTGRRVPIVTLFQAPTVAQLASVIETGGWLRPWTSMVEIQRGDGATPLFYVAPFLISALSFHDLASELGEDRPLFVFQPQGLEDDAPIHRSVEEMASHYIEEMRTVQPTGPYLIGGHCAGGWVAYEMARQLEASNAEVRRLVIVDVEPPGVEVPPTKWVSYILSRIRLYVGSGRLLAALMWQFRLRVVRRVADRGVTDERRRAERVGAVHLDAHARYQGGRYAGDLVLIRSDEWARLADKNWHLAWRDIVDGSVVVEIVPGAHSELLSGGTVDAVARIVRSHIAGA